MRLLDLFCGAGGAAMGYHQAGFEILGVDIKPQKNYPFEFIQADWQEVLRFTDSFDIDVIHASPPCQRYSKMTKKWGKEEGHPDLINSVREELQAMELPYIIENVEGAPLIDPTLLCGSMFNLGIPEKGGQLRRHRLFETNFPLGKPDNHIHKDRSIGVYGHTGGKSNRDDILFWTVEDWRLAMEINWMTGSELTQAIPPAYTKYIGNSLNKLLNFGTF